MKDIEEAYEESFEESLAKSIEEKTSGDYQDLLLRILQPFDIEPDPKANHKKKKSYFYPSWFCSFCHFDLKNICFVHLGHFLDFVERLRELMKIFSVCQSEMFCYDLDFKEKESMMI